MTKPCGIMPGGSPWLTREQVLDSEQGGREGEGGVGGEVHKSSWHLPYLLPLRRSSCQSVKGEGECRREKCRRRGSK